MERLEGAERIEQSFEDCDSHYHGMLEVYKEALMKIRGDNKEEVQSILSSDHLNVEGSTPIHVGRKDALKILERIDEEIRMGGYMNKAEATEYLESEVRRLERIVG